MVDGVWFFLDGLSLFVGDAEGIVLVESRGAEVPGPDLGVDVVRDQGSGTEAVSSGELAEDHLLVLGALLAVCLFCVSQIFDLVEELFVLFKVFEHLVLDGGVLGVAPKRTLCVSQSRISQSHRS